MSLRAWKPNLLVPVTNPNSTKGVFSFLQNVAFPKGSVKLLGISPDQKDNELIRHINGLSQAFQQRGVFSSWAIINTKNLADGVNFANQAYRGSFFKPNIVFLNMLDRESYENDFHEIIAESARLKLGLLIYFQHPKSGLGQRQFINIWIRNRAPLWKISWDIGNLDLSILVAYKLKKNWIASIRLVTVVDNKNQEIQANKFMSELIDLARLPKTETLIHIGDFNKYILDAPNADLNIFGLVPEPDFKFMAKMVDNTQTTCLFIRDSGMENILA